MLPKDITEVVGTFSKLGSTYPHFFIESLSKLMSTLKVLKYATNVIAWSADVGVPIDVPEELNAVQEPNWRPSEP